LSSLLEGYIYPDLLGAGGICDMYDGVACEVNTDLCCYNTEKWCPMGSPNCDRFDRAAYPVGDQRIYSGQMTDALALSPFPNAILWNWATILILGFGNLAALDFSGPLHGRQDTHDGPTWLHYWRTLDFFHWCSLCLFGCHYTVSTALVLSYHHTLRYPSSCNPLFF
jgi:hypothetical protein